MVETQPTTDGLLTPLYEQPEVKQAICDALHKIAEEQYDNLSQPPPVAVADCTSPQVGDTIVVNGEPVCVTATAVMEEDATPATPSPEPPQPVESKMLTRKEWKQAMRLYFTVRHPRVVQCGHKLDIGREPRHNCESCWFAFFNQHGELIETADQVFQEHGAKALAAMRGDRFVKNFTRFMATLAQWKAAQERGLKVENGGHVLQLPHRPGVDGDFLHRPASDSEVTAPQENVNA